MKSTLKTLPFLLLHLWVNARQSKVDSTIMLFNKSAGSNKLDTASFDAGYNFLAAASLTDSQFSQIETVASNYKSTKPNYTANDIRQAVFESISRTDPAKAIKYGKLQIEKLDKLNAQLPFQKIVKTVIKI